MFWRNTCVTLTSLIFLVAFSFGTGFTAWNPPPQVAPGIDAQGDPTLYERIHKKAPDPAGDSELAGDMIGFYYDQNVDRLAFRAQMNRIMDPSGSVNLMERDGVRVYICMDYQSGGTIQLPDNLPGTASIQWDRCLVLWSDGGAQARLYDADFLTTESERIKNVRITPKWYMVEASLWLPEGFEEVVVQSMGGKASEYGRVAPEAAAGDLTPVNFYVFTASGNRILDVIEADNNSSKEDHNVALMHHGNQSLTWTDVMWGNDPLGWDFHWASYDDDSHANNGFDEVLGLHDKLDEPVNIHFSSTLQTAAAWYYPTGTLEGFNEWMARGVSEGWCGMITSAFAQQIMPFLYDAINDTAVAKENALINNYFDYIPHVAWVPERVWVENPDVDGNGTDASYAVVDNTIKDNWLPHGVYAVMLDQHVHCNYRNTWDHDKHIYTIWADAGSLNVIPMNGPFIGHINWGTGTEAMGDVLATTADEILVYGNDWEVTAEVAGQGHSGSLNTYIYVVNQCHADPTVKLWKLDDVIGSFYDSPPRITLQNGTYDMLGKWHGYGGGYIPSHPANSWYADWDTTKSHSDFHTPKWSYGQVWRDVYDSLAAAPNNNILQAGWYVFLSMLYETGWHDGDEIAGWEHQHSAHIKNAHVYAAAAHWANGSWAATGASMMDIDHDGVEELAMWQDKVLAVFEPTGGRAQWVFTKDDTKGYAYSVIGADNAYYGCTEGDYNDNYGGCNTWNHVGAFSDMDPWYEHQTYSMVINSGSGSHLEATLSHGVLTKVIELDQGNHYIEATYDVGPMTSFIQSGFSPDLTDMTRTGDRERIWDPEAKYMGLRNPNSGATACYVLGDGQCSHNKDMQGTLTNTDEIKGPDEFRFFIFAGYTDPPDGNGEIAVLESLATLITDTFSPKVRETAEFVDDNTVGILFNEKVDPVTAQTPSNYAFSGFDSAYTATAATLQGDSVRVWLDIDKTFVAGDSGRITVSNVKDRANNVVDPSANYADLHVPPCFTPHTVTVDGTKDFNAECEILDSLVADPNYEGDGEYDYLYFTWDNDHVYIGYDSTDFNNNGDLFIYFDSDTGGTNSSTDWHVVHEFPPGFKADYSINVEGGSWQDKRTYNAGTGQWDMTFLGNTGCEAYVGWSGKPYTEISVPDSEIAYDHSDTLKIIVYCQADTLGDMWTAYPPGNPHGKCRLDRYYLFESLDPGVQPNLAYQVILEDATPPADFDVGGDGVIALAEIVCWISWSPIEEDTAGCPEVIDYYVILRDTHPDSIGPEDSLAATTDTFYVDSTAAVGNTSVNHYYAIVAVDEGGNKSAPSGILGEFDKDLSNVK
jgi:hypothetical protein